ncbi:MAG TPA: hypothetical protein VFB63_03670 [Bryobacteraceae bacterium]|jgi:hypothetical protein|nr:hypothetical protein [Bryobacteraceae bacterium]
MTALIEAPLLLFLIIAGLLSTVSAIGSYLAMVTGINADRSRGCAMGYSFWWDS